ncbi:unnamed protein product [Oreochromis niloticus]|nr:unnamed protein product [Mustela putorius furo]
MEEQRSWSPSNIFTANPAFKISLDSSALINGMAKEGGGHAQFITGTDRMQPKVMQSLHFSLQPAVEDVSVTWNLPKGSTITVLSPPITSFFQGQRGCCCLEAYSKFPHAKKPPRDPLLQLVSLQKASGCWLLDAAVAAALGKTNEEVEKSKPEKASSEVWATILALIWLHGFKMDAKDEWELLAAKAVSWLSAQKAPSVTECVEARNILLGCSVQKDCPWPLRFLLS